MLSKKMILITGVFALSLNPVYASTGHQSHAAAQSFNPEISLVLDGRYTDIESSELVLPGFQLGGHAGLPNNGFETGHNEISISSTVDDKFFGLLSVALMQHDGSTEVELEEAYFETLQLGHGFNIKGGQFLSGFGYLNSVHLHAHDFADRPLAYDALVGGHLIDTGLQVNWVAPSDMYFSIGSELTTGTAYPGGENEDGQNGFALYAKTGGDMNTSSSWQLGASYYYADFNVREAGGHHHHGGHGHSEEVDNELVEGEAELIGIDFVYKWAPNGNSKDTNLKLQAEYIVKQEDGIAEFTESASSAEADYDGEQKGFYIQGIYQFKPSWRVGLRYDRLSAENTVSNFEGTGLDLETFLDESGIGTRGNDPSKNSIMVDYSPSHFSRLRLQFSQLDNGLDTIDYLMLQYIMSIGSHSAHSF